jgi:predicted phosphoribosyltransferase
MFRNRKEAGEHLAKKLRAFMSEDLFIIALPRGGVAVAYEVAQQLHAPLDIVVTRKIGHPTYPEYAIGVVNAQGATLFNESEASAIDPQWLHAEVAREQQEAQRREMLYRKGRAPLEVAGKTVVLVDDGAATGLTCMLALKVLRTHKPKKLLLAVPVASRAVMPELEHLFDGCIVLEMLGSEGAVGAHYVAFPQLTDEEVVYLLNTAGY